MKKPSDLKQRVREGAIRRASRDVHIAEESATLGDTLSFEEEELVRKGEAQAQVWCSHDVRWDDVKNT